MATKKTTQKKTAKTRVTQSNQPATAKEKKETIDAVTAVLDNKKPGFVMVSLLPEKGKGLHRMVGYEISKMQIGVISAAHLELDPMQAMLIAIKAQK